MAPNPKSHPGPVFYSADPSRPEIDEHDQDLVISGEEPPEPDATDKPVRYLTNFSVFDPRHHSEMVSLVELEEVDATKDRDFVATGFVSAFVEGGDEDEGEDEVKEADMPFVRLGSLFRYYAENDAVWLETAQAWYILQEPSPGYGPFFEDFCCHKTTQPMGSSSTPSRPAKTRAPNIDSFVLLSENQTPTHVTPLIAQLAGTNFGDGLVIIGPRLPPPSKEEEDWHQRKELAKVRCLIRKAHQIDQQERKKRIKSTYWMDKDNGWLNAIDLGGDTFKVGNIVLVAPGEGREVNTLPIPVDDQDIPLGATVATYFWFARIISLSAEDSIAHLRWFEHGSYTVMEEFANPQQLYLNDMCSSVDVHCLIETVNVHYQPSGPIPPQDYFYSSRYQHDTATVIAVDNFAEDAAAAQLHPENCLVCGLAREKDHEKEIRRLDTPPGVAYLGHTYHEGDFAEILSGNSSGLCDIGQILGFHEDGNQVLAYIRCLGRISSISHIQDFPSNYVKDEKQLFTSDEEKVVFVTSFIRPCVILPPHDGFVIHKWQNFINNSPHHFYVRYRFPSLHPISWTEGQADNWWERGICPQCPNDLVQLEGGVARSDLYSNFVDAQLRTQLRTLDLFGGCGAFSAGMTQGAPFIEVTHAVEISPSAAQTFMQNSPVKMYNNCANLILHYFIKNGQGHGLETPTQLFDDKTPLPAPLKPGDIDMMTIGFPCQSHSGLNRFKKVNDSRSNLILTALSYVDFLRPRYCYFENVRGFLQFNISAEQAGKDAGVGGINMGGLKFLLRVLNELGYQYHFALLQAAHYGTPQQRVRFFLIAARMGNPLPSLPQPSHYFPSNDSLTITSPIGVKISPIIQTMGSYAHPFVTVGDAISDLPRFDWRHPDSDKITAEDHERRQLNIPAIPCLKTGPWCGPTGHEAAYFHTPNTAFQVQCRLNEPPILQQYTKVFVPDTVARVVSIPLWAKADYRDLPVDMNEWQTSNPVSAIAKSGYKAGLYGRLDPDGWFSTTVTNVNPTAKQSKVLNPYCKRMVTVRELARSQGFPDDFEFKAIDNNIITMHRQIGNAVPWPLSRALGRELGKALYNKWLADRRNAVVVSLDSP